MPYSVRFDAVEDAIADIKNGKIIVVVDDENRENEGDFIAAAECVTPEMINFMALHGRGLICTPITESYCRKLELYPMVMKSIGHVMNWVFLYGTNCRGVVVVWVTTLGKKTRKICSKK